MATAVRTIMSEEVNWSDGRMAAAMTINTPSCKGPWWSEDRGQDTLACCRCQNLRNLMYNAKVVALTQPKEIELFGRILESFPFVEFVRVACGVKPDEKVAILYPLRPPNPEERFVREKLKEQFRVWKDLRIGQRQIVFSQLYNRYGYHPVVLPNAETLTFKEYGGDDGVKHLPDGRISILDMDKAFASGKYVYAINYRQALVASGLRPALTYDDVEIF